jgi:hypothetical protein
MDSIAPFGTRGLKSRSVPTTRKYKIDSISLIWRTVSTKLIRYALKPSTGTLFSAMGLAVKEESSGPATCLDF